MHKRKIGFTIVELVVIIAIVAILAALLVPTFSSMIDNAKRIGDIQLVKNLNTSLKADYTEHGTMYSAMKAVKASGYTEETIKNISTSDKNFVAWDSMNDRFVLISKETNTYIFPIDPDNESGEIENLYDYFVIYDDVPETQTYSIYLSKNATVPEANVTVGFDAGENYGVSKLKYDRSQATNSRTVTIRTNSGTVCEYKGFISNDGTGDTIHHYGEAGSQTIICANTSFHEHGAATEVEIKMGHYVQESGSIVAVINASAGEGDVVVDLKSGSIQGTVKNTNENNSVTITSEKNVKTVNFEAKLDGGKLTVNLTSQPSYANTTDRNVTNDNSNAVSISGVGTEERPIPAYDAVEEENAECVSVAGYSIKVYTNCNAYEYTEITANTGSAQEETTQEETAYVENTYTVINNGDGTTETVKSHDHNWSDPKEWTWEGYTKATAVFECQDKDCNLTETVIVPDNYGNITYSVTKAATCTEQGEITYTATITHHDKEHISVNKENIPIDLNEHNWDEVTYTWAEDNSKCTATRVCKNSADHSETETVIAITNGSERTATFENEAFGTHTIKLYATFTTVFPNVDEYLYRVGNGNTVKLWSLFKVEEGTTVSDNENVSVTVSQIAGNAALESYTKNDSDWTQSTLKFSGTGPVKVTIKDGGGKGYTLNLEVVDGYNVTQYSELQNRNSVLLNDITMSSGGKYYLSNATLYGNGFTFDVKNAAHAGTSSESNNYVIGLNNSILDNVQIIGKVYTSYGGTTNADWNYPCVLVNGGNCVIANSYIANCASPIRARGGANLILKNTTLKGGSFCNLDIRSGVKLTIDGLTTINQVEGNDKDDNGTTIIGLGIIVYYEGSNGSERITIQGKGLTQYNYVANNQSDNAVSSAKTVFNNIFNINSEFVKTVDNVKWVNTGILSLTSTIGSDSITNPNGYNWQDVSMLGQSGHLCTQLATNFPTSLPVTPQNYSSDEQYTIAPSYSFEYPISAGKTNYLAKTDGSNDYCYWDSTTSSILIGFDEGNDFTFDPNILTITKNNHSIIPTVSLDGETYHEVSSSILINSAGEHTLTFKYIDPYNYDKVGNQSYDVEYTKIVNIVATEAKANIKPASFDFREKGYKSITANNTTYIMPNVSETTTNSIGSKTIGGETVYYPIVFVKYATSKNGNPDYTTDIDTNVRKSDTTQAYCPIFDGVITITDYDTNNNAITYGSSTTTMADGHLTYVESDVKTALTWSSADTPSTLPVVKSSKLYFRSVAIQGVNRNQTMSIIEYIYTDTSGNTYHYFVKYVFPSKGLGVKMLGYENEKYTITINVEDGNGTVDKKSITNVSRGSNINSSGNDLKNGNKTIATATPNSGYNTKWEGLPSKFLDDDITITVSFSTSSSSGSCVTPGTLITLADGTQVPVETLTGDEMLLVWNLETGKLDSAPIMFIDSDPETEYEVIKLRFSDGTEVKVISEHGFWDYDLNEYVYLDENASQYIGHAFAKQNGNALEEVTLTDVSIEIETTSAWSPVTVGHLCYFVDGMLSMPGGISGLFNIFEVDAETMAYDAEQMQSDIDTYGLLTLDDFGGMITEEMFYAFNGQYLSVAVGKDLITWDYINYLAERYSPLCDNITP